VAKHAKRNNHFDKNTTSQCPKAQNPGITTPHHIFIYATLVR